MIRLSLRYSLSRIPVLSHIHKTQQLIQQSTKNRASYFKNKTKSSSFTTLQQQQQTRTFATRQIKSRHPASPSNSTLTNLFIRPAIFTTLVVTGSFGLTTLIDGMDYKLPYWAVDMNERTSYLWPVVAPVILGNVAIFLFWQRRSVPKFFDRHFVNRQNIPSLFALVGSAFSQKDFMHLATNMLAFYGFARSIVETEGPGDTISIYLTCAVVSSWLAGVAGALHPAFRIVRIGSLGASGAVIGIISYSVLSRPDMKLSLDFLPGNMSSISAASMLYGLVLVDCLGLVFGWKRMGHACHLAGAVTGAGFYYGGLDFMQHYKKWIRTQMDSFGVLKVKER